MSWVDMFSPYRSPSLKSFLEPVIISGDITVPVT